MSDRLKTIKPLSERTLRRRAADYKGKNVWVSTMHSTGYSGICHGVGSIMENGQKLTYLNMSAIGRDGTKPFRILLRVVTRIDFKPE